MFSLSTLPVLRLSAAILATLSVFPFSAAHADIAGPVLSKAEACTQPDGQNHNRLAVTVDGKATATEYFFKEGKTLYYFVFSDFRHYRDQTTYDGQAARQIRLYRYGCASKQIVRYPVNFKDYLPGTYWGPANPTSSFKTEANLGRVYEKTWDLLKVSFEIAQGGEGVSGYIFDLKTEQVVAPSRFFGKDPYGFEAKLNGRGTWSGTDVWFGYTLSPAFHKVGAVEKRIITITQQCSHAYPSEGRSEVFPLKTFDYDLDTGRSSAMKVIQGSEVCR